MILNIGKWKTLYTHLNSSMLNVRISVSHTAQMVLKVHYYYDNICIIYSVEERKKENYIEPEPVDGEEVHTFAAISHINMFNYLIITYAHAS